jgi:ribosomal protein S18 acetylase RimI-like enzyme
MSITLRSINSDDDEFLLELYGSTRQEEMALWGWGLEQQRAFVTMQFRAQQAGYRHQYPQAQQQIILWRETAVGRWILNHSESEILLVDISLLPEYRGQGIGTALLEGLLNQARLEQKSVRLHVLKSNRAKNLYYRIGFVNTKQTDVYITMEYQKPYE